MIITIIKNITFYLTRKCQKSFELLKQRFTTAPTLAYFDYKKEYILKTNSLDNVSIVILFQYRKDGLLYPVAFFFCKHLF